ncbi:MAG: hypothetical protein ACI8RZ_001081 [Myxococcota bacterium]|jgi:hypothetical protein
MAPSLRPAGKNHTATAADIINSIVSQLSSIDLAYSLPSVRRLLSLLARLQPDHVATLLPMFLQNASPAEAAVLWATQAENLTNQPEEALATLQRARASTATDCWVWGAIGRAEARLGLDPAVALTRAQEAAHYPEAHPLFSDLLAIPDLDRALELLQLLSPPPPDTDTTHYTNLCAALYEAGRLSEILPIIQQHRDILVQATILRSATEAPIRAQDVDAVFLITTACPAAYRSDLLEAVVLQWIDSGRIGAAHRVLQHWGETSPGNVIRLGMLAMLGDEAATDALKAELEERLEVEEVAWHDTWRYQDLGRACGWAGDLGGTLAALERVVDHEDRMTALLSAVRYAPLTAREPLLCAARGLAASMQDDRHRAESVGHLAALQVDLGRRRAGLTQLEEASRLAIGVRRPRSNQGFARRSALESVIADQLHSEDNLGAFRTTRKLRTRHMRNPHLTTIAHRYATMGDLGGVMCCLENMHPDISRVEAGTEALHIWLAAGQPVITTEAA